MNKEPLFKTYLLKASANTRTYDIFNVFQRRKDISTYYWNCASDLHAAALLLGNALESNLGIDANTLGLDRGFSLDCALPPPFRLNAALSIELLLKAIGKILDRPEQHHHRLNVLCEHVGMQISNDMAAILDIFTESIYWSGRYPVPKDVQTWENSLNIKSSLYSITTVEEFSFWKPIPERMPNLENYEKIWSYLNSYYSEATENISEP